MTDDDTCDVDAEVTQYFQEAKLKYGEKLSRSLVDRACVEQVDDVLHDDNHHDHIIDGVDISENDSSPSSDTVTKKSSSTKQQNFDLQSIVRLTKAILQDKNSH